MGINFYIRVSAVLLCGMLALSAPGRAGAEQGPPGHGHGKTKNAHGVTKKMRMEESDHTSKDGDKPIIMTMEELHNHGGTPPGWRFRIPKGDVADGRKAFVKMECFACHNIDGEKFPKLAEDPAKVGPDLTGMGPMHGDGAYFFESIVNPSRIIVKGPGYIKNGLSVMPSYADSMTLQEAVDLVAYLKSLQGGHEMGGMKKDAGHGGGMKDMKKH